MALMVPKHGGDNEPFLTVAAPVTHPLWPWHQCLPLAGRKYTSTAMAEMRTHGTMMLMT